MGWKVTIRRFFAVFVAFSIISMLKSNAVAVTLEELLRGNTPMLMRRYVFPLQKILLAKF